MWRLFRRSLHRQDRSLIGEHQHRQNRRSVQPVTLQGSCEWEPTTLRHTGSSVASSGTSRPIQCCIACHGTGVLTAEQNVTIFSLLASLPPRSVTLRCSNETLSRVTFECDSAVSIIRESDQLKYPRYTVLEVACGKESVIARSCREVDYVRYIGIHANLQEIGVRNKALTLLRDGFSRCPHGSQMAPDDFRR